MPIPTGDWTINGNGFVGTLSIKSVDGNGRLGAGSSVFDGQIAGFWDEAAQRLTFTRADKGGSAESAQFYVGYLMKDRAAPGTQRLAGSFEGFRGSGATAARSTFGWFAEQPKP
jgi:hypothetical protein